MCEVANPRPDAPVIDAQGLRKSFYGQHHALTAPLLATVTIGFRRRDVT